MLREPHVQVTAAAFLNPTPDAESRVNVQATLARAGPIQEEIRQRPYYQKPFWSLERARVGNTRRVPVEVVVNGQAVARKEIVADGSLQKVQFDVPIRRSSWVAVRILPSSHTNPIFVLVGGKPVRPSCRSAQWCLDGVNQCWTQKAPKISPTELPDARKAYDHALEVYKKMLGVCTED